MVLVSYTYALLPVSRETFDEIKRALLAAGYEHAFRDDGEVIDMHGIALQRKVPDTDPDKLALEQE